MYLYLTNWIDHSQKNALLIGLVTNNDDIWYIYVPFMLNFGNELLYIDNKYTGVNYVVDTVQCFFFDILIEDPNNFKAPKFIIILYVVK